MPVKTEIGRYTAHVDTFCADHMPTLDQLPVIFRDLPEYSYPERVNCAVELLDRMVVSGCGERTVFIHDSGSWTYRRLLETANRIARVLVEDLGVVPGNRVLLRGPNHPMLAACWFAMIKSGAIAVTTSCLLRCREIVAIADKAHISLALCDARYTTDCAEAFTKHEDGSPRMHAQVIAFNSNDAGTLDAMIAGKPNVFQNCDTSAEDVAVVAFT